MQGPGKTAATLHAARGREQSAFHVSSGDGLAFFGGEPLVEGTALFCHVDEEVARLETVAAGFRQPIAQIDKGFCAHAVDVGDGAASERRKAETEDRADVGLAHIGDHALLDAAGGFERLDGEEPALQPGTIALIRVALLLLESRETWTSALSA